MNIIAEFVISAAAARDFPQDGLPEVAIVGRSNVGKSSLINALLRQRLARTSSTPGKTRLANVYRVSRGGGTPFYLVDLPGYGYARGGSDGFEELTRAYFERVRLKTDMAAATRRTRLGPDGTNTDSVEPHAATPAAALLLVDVRHPGLASDRAAWQWLLAAAERAALVGTKVDKLARGQRIRALRELESVFEDSVLPVSAVTGEGLDELWKLIDRLANSRKPHPRSRPSTPPREMAPRPRKK